MDTIGLSLAENKTFCSLAGKRGLIGIPSGDLGFCIRICETFDIFDLKVGRCVQLNKLMKLNAT